MRRLATVACASLFLAATLAAAWDASRIQAQARARGLPAEAMGRVSSLVNAVAAARGLGAEQQADAINAWFNERLDWREDALVWSRPDYWASPLEMLAKGAGDCEDLAMGKYFAMLAVGVPEAQLRLVYVRAMIDGRPQAHMVLAWTPKGESDPWILDNLNPRRQRAGTRTDLQPVFSFNTEGLWQGTGGANTGSSLTRLTPWRDALTRARDEGFTP